MTKVFVSTPCYGGMITDGYFQSVIRAQDQIARSSVVESVTWTTNAGESLIPRARNNAVREFMTSDCDVLLFIDADLSFDWYQVERLLTSGYEVCGGLYPLKRIFWENLVGKTFETPDEMVGASLGLVTYKVGEVQPDGFAEVLDLGTGFLAIRRSAIERLVTEYEELIYFDEASQCETIDIFDTMIDRSGEGGRRRYLSEDYAFCRRWQGVGGEVYADLEGGILVHQGLYRYGAAHTAQAR